MTAPIIQTPAAHPKPGSQWWQAGQN